MNFFHEFSIQMSIEQLGQELEQTQTWLDCDLLSTMEFLLEDSHRDVGGDGDLPGVLASITDQGWRHDSTITVVDSVTLEPVNGSVNRVVDGEIWYEEAGSYQVVDGNARLAALKALYDNPATRNMLDDVLVKVRILMNPFNMTIPQLRVSQQQEEQNERERTEDIFYAN
jgi:hypothetical protein